MTRVESPPGFFGKVSSQGDFVSRRLPQQVLSSWDSWLQSCIQASRQQLDAAWLQTYLTSPVWRFALAPGIVDEQAWGGVLMPSVDRVGRHFPLMISAGAAGGASLLDWLENGKQWYDEVEDLALSSLEADFRLDDFDAALLAKTGLPAGAGAGSAAGAAGWRFPSAGLDQIGSEMAPLTATVARTLLAGHSLWWTDGSQQVMPSVLLCRGLPEPSAFAAMLDGSWQRDGWRPGVSAGTSAALP